MLTVYSIQVNPDHSLLDALAHPATSKQGKLPHVTKWRQTPSRRERMELHRYLEINGKAPRIRKMQSHRSQQYVDSLPRALTKGMQSHPRCQSSGMSSTSSAARVIEVL